MADNILRLTVNSTDYDAKLKKAAEGIRHLADVAHQSGGELTGLEKAELDYIKALGEMETKSRTAAGSVRELENTYKELKVIYDQLNDVEKADEGGKALAASLDQLKQRAQAARAELDNASKSLNDNGQSAQQSGGILESLAGKFTLNIDAIKLFNIGLQAAEGALSVAKDAFFASEATVDEWGRVVDSSKSLYEGFLTAINTGDISGYLGRIDEIVQAARKAYDELDRLGTMKTIQAPKMSAQQTENERMRMMIQTGRYIAPVDGRKASMKDGQLLTPEQIRRIEAQLQNGIKSVASLVGNEVKQTGKAIDAVYDRQAKELGLSLSEFRKGTSSIAEFDKRMAGYEQYQKWREQHTTIDMQSGREIVARGNPFEQFAKWGTFRVDGQRYNDLVRLIQQRDQQAGQAYSMQSQAYRTMNRAEGVTVRQIMGGTGGKSGTTDSEKELTIHQQIAKLEEEAYTATDERRTAIAKQVQELDQVLERQKTIRDQVHGIEKETKAQPVEMAKGLSGFNEQTISAWTAMMKSELSKADLGSVLYSSLTNNMEDMSRLTQTVQSAMKLGLDVPQDTVQQIFERIFDGENMPADMYDSMIQKFIEDFKERTGKDLVVGENGGLSEGTPQKRKDESDGNQFMKKNDEGKYEAKMTDIMSGMAGGINNVVSGLNTLGVEIPAGLQSVLGGMQAISSILSGIAVTVMAIEALSGVDAFIPFAGGGIVPKFANGGLIGKAAGGMLIPGNSFSGDHLRMPVDGGRGWIGVNSGELILNKAQQGNIASLLSDSGFGNMHLETEIEAESIKIILNNNGERTGHGEYLTARLS